MAEKDTPNPPSEPQAPLMPRPPENMPMTAPPGFALPELPSRLFGLRKLFGLKK
jgi:hypothetical protein